MATTTHYSWPIPVATDYVKDGWDAIADLGNAIDTTVYGLGTAGLSLVTSTTVTAQSSITISNCFNSTYQNYVIHYKFASSDQITFQLTSGGTAATGANYSYSYVYYNSTTNPTRYSNTSGTGILMSYGGFNVINISCPNLAEATYLNTHSVSPANPEILLTGAVHTLTNAYDGIKLTPTSGTFTGTVKVYGYKNS